MKLLLSLLLGLAALASAVAQECDNPFKGVVYYTNPVTGRFGLYFAYELEPNHLYRIEVTTDAKHYDTIQLLDTTGFTHEIYESFNVDPCNGLWPRVIDLGDTR